MRTPYQRLEAARRSHDRLALTREAERLATEGNSERAIYVALEEILSDLREAKAPDEEEDRVTDVMDRLVGWCLAENRIVTPPSVLPTESEIETLPRWARVAFAARCARRVLPLHKFGRSEPLLPDREPEKSSYAVEVAEYAAEKATPWRNATENYLQAMSSGHKLYDGRDFVGYSATSAAAYAAADAGDDERPVRAIIASRYAASAARLLANIDGDIRRDYDRIAQLARDHFWTDETPVPPSEFGPLWPHGRPAGWPPVEEPPSAAQPVPEPVH